MPANHPEFLEEFSMQRSRQQGAATEDFSRLLDRVHEIGRGVVLASARDVDRDARFPSEGIGALKELRLLSAYVPTELGGASAQSISGGIGFT